MMNQRSLPASTARGGADATEAEARLRRRVLVVDDEPDILETLPGALERLLDLPVEVDTAGSGEEAKAKLERAAYDLVLTDERMPGLRGTELLQWLRTAHPGTARVLMSAYIEGYARRDAGGEPSAQLFLPKPFRLERVLPQLRALLAPQR